VQSLRRLSDRTPLRVKLVAALLVLVSVALIGSGLAATATLRGYLTHRVDQQLVSASRGFTERGFRPPGGPGGDGLRLPSTFVVQVQDANGAALTQPRSNLINDDEPLPRLPEVTADEAATRAQHPFTVPAVSGETSWRVLALPARLPNGSTGTLLVAQSLGDVQSTVRQLLLLLLVIGAVTIVVVGGVALFVVRANLRPLREVERTAAAIADGDLSQRVPSGHPDTEVGQLAAALNGMLAQIESAFAASSESEATARRSEEQMRRFVADASHELRTPLTSIRGFAELYRQGAADVDDVPRLMRRIEDEGKRMGLLVDDLLLLARLDQERPLEQEPVDMLTLAGDAVHDAQAVAPKRPITLEVGNTEPPPVVVGDEARLRQVLGNLVGNALTHTPAGTPVTVRVRTETESASGVVIVDVVDEGPGMTEEHAARVFERFYRTDASRNRAAGGTGLGLAIVAALTAGHGGTVAVETAPGRGTTFQLRLPLTTVAPAKPPVSVRPPT
jgi:two-component system OmpR family sensor kinase